MVFDWNEEKNEQLKKERKIGFERIVIAIEAGDIVLARGSLRGVVAAINLSKATFKKIKQNLFLKQDVRFITLILNITLSLRVTVFSLLHLTSMNPIFQPLILLLILQ